MALGTFATGPYTATYDATDAATGTPGKASGARAIGMVQNVHRFTRTMQAESITGTNLYGKTAIDAIYQGGDCFVLFTIKEWKSYIRDILWPFGAAFGDVGTIGRLLTDLAGELVLTPVSGTPAYTNDAKVITFGKAILSPAHNTEIMYGPVPRDVSLVFQCFPYSDGGNPAKDVWFTEASV